MQHRDLPERWKQKVEEYLIEKGKGEYKRLSAYDFHASKKVEIQFDDGSFASFNYAFVLKMPEHRELCVFTEHCGYHVFPYQESGIKIQDKHNHDS